MLNKLKGLIKGTFKRKSLPLYLFLYALGGCLGLLQGGLLGGFLGLASTFLSSLLVIFGIVPFAGLPLYIFFSKFLFGILGKYADISLAQTVSFYIFGIFAGFVWVIITALVILLVLKVLIFRGEKNA